MDYESIRPTMEKLRKAYATLEAIKRQQDALYEHEIVDEELHKIRVDSIWAASIVSWRKIDDLEYEVGDFFDAGHFQMFIKLGGDPMQIPVVADYTDIIWGHGIIHWPDAKLDNVADEAESV